jgi:SAM-dependent methyltransferase
MRAFRDTYLLSEASGLKVLDVGSGSDDDWSYRWLFKPPRFEYTGLDLESGQNVDIVPTDPFDWTEIPTDSFDAVISGQTFEHNPYFWITTAEIARVVRPGGFVAIVAPSEGRVHRFPLDCWRFYPDSWSALCTYVGLELLEGYTEPASWRLVIPGRHWADAMMIARKPDLTDELATKAFYSRLEAIVATRAIQPVPSVGPARAGTEYAQTHVLPMHSMIWHMGHVVSRARPDLKNRWPLLNVRRYFTHRNSRLAQHRGVARSAMHRSAQPNSSESID